LVGPQEMLRPVIEMEAADGGTDDAKMDSNINGSRFDDDYSIISMEDIEDTDDNEDMEDDPMNCSFL